MKNRPAGGNKVEDISTPTIMMVDDETTTLEMIQLYLMEAGYTKFIQISDSTIALNALEEADPDILLLDLIMPEVSGHEILAELRKKPKFRHLPILVLTASTSTDDKIRALDLGATDFLAKPVDPTELALRVRNTAAAKSYLDYLAFYDALTDLPNKYMFLDRFDWAIKNAKRSNEQLALLNIALDDFDNINATIGNAAADQILQEVAFRIEQVVRDNDVLGPAIKFKAFKDLNLFRVEGSAFSLLLDRIHGAESAAHVAGRLIKAIREPFKIHDLSIHVKASIGIANYPEDSSERDALIHLACGAKDYIKNRGGDNFQFSNKTINDTYTKKRKIESSLVKAIAGEEFELQYQPKVCVSSGKIKGVEALVRWTKDGQSVSPDDFIPVAEQTGLIVPLGEQVLKIAFRQLAEWHAAGIMISMSVNLSAKQLRSSQFHTIVETIVASSNVDPLYLTLEITESLLMEDIEQTISILERFRDMGLKISIDDFGTGYSSLNYHNSLPIHELKIDRSFVKDIPDNKKRNAIVSAIIYLSESLGIQTVAEGVENEKQLRFLKDNQCHQYQGYLFSQPLTNKELLRLVKD